MVDTLVNNDLVVVLNLLAAGWAADAKDYHRGKLHAQARERAFCSGMSDGFADSTNELLKLLHSPTVQGVITLAQLLDQRYAQAEHPLPDRSKALNFKAHTFGAAEAYRRCANTLTISLAETLRSAKSLIDYPC